MVSLKTVNTIVEVILAAIVVAGASYVSWAFFSAVPLPPTKYYSATVLNSPISSADDSMIGQMVLDRRRNCPGDTKRSVLRIIEGTGIEEIVYRDEVPIATTLVGESIVLKFKIPLPRPRQAGTYVYRGASRFDCDGKIFSLETPAAPFQVR